MTSEVLHSRAHPAIDPKIEALYPPLLAEERARLEADLIADGCREPLVVWREKGVLLDGHHRLAICKRLGLDYQVQRVPFATREEVETWVQSNVQPHRRPIPQYPIHPSADEFPMLDEKRLAKLANDIQAHGLLEPVELWRDDQNVTWVIDGRNRLQACVIAGIAPSFAEIQTDNPWRYVWSKNGQRRDLPDLTRNAAFLGCDAGAKAYDQAKRVAGDARKADITVKQQDNAHTKRYQDGRNDSAHLGTKECETSQEPTQAQKNKRQRNEANRASSELAKQAGTSRATMEKTLAIKHHDDQHGTQFLHDIKTGKIKPTKALTTVRKANLAAKVRAQMEQVETRPVIKQQNALDFLGALPDGYADLLLTDPPYSTDVDDLDGFIASWLPLALSKIKPTGRAFICIGAYPNELRAYLNALASQDQMILANVLVWTYRNTLGPAPKTDYKLNWQAILYLRGKDAGALDCPVMTEQFSVMDINAPDGRQGDRYHAWQKPLEIGERFVRHASQPGQVVIDPFACTGTFLLAAAKLGRMAIGCDIDDAAIELAFSRGCVAPEEVRHAA